VPPYRTHLIDDLAGWLVDGDVAVLSGAGLSTESGIPDYRGPTGAARRGTPMTFGAFTEDPQARQRYWARSHLGWRVVGQARPNAGHHGVTRLQRLGLVPGIITQNVDGLHQASGARSVIELHGNLAHTICRDCGDRRSRAELVHRLAAANPHFAAHATAARPDGDAELDDAAVATFRVVGCRRCDGVLKPDGWSSASRCRRSGWPGRSSWWTGPGHCSCWAPR
jgi:NAD-dependent SIR2 family protein deacetylase